MDEKKILQWTAVEEEENKKLGGDHADRVGLALSGGGIRSGIFALGVIQYLAQRGWFKEIDYLSTVSGGGYIGGWLSALIYRSNAQSKKQDPQIALQVSDELMKEIGDPQSEVVQHVREYSNYLNPHTGLTIDTLSMAGLVVGNMLLSIVIVTLLLGCIAFGTLFLGLCLLKIINTPPDWHHIWWFSIGSIVMSFFGFCLMFKPVDAILNLHRKIKKGDQAKQKQSDAESEKIKEKFTKVVHKGWIRAGCGVLAVAFLGISSVYAWILGNSIHTTLRNPIFWDLIQFNYAFIYSDPLNRFIQSVEIFQSASPLPFSLPPWLTPYSSAFFFTIVYLICNLPMFYHTLFELQKMGSGYWSKKWSSGLRLIGFFSGSVIATTLSGIAGGFAAQGLIYWLSKYISQPWTCLILGAPVAVAAVIVALAVHLLFLGRYLTPELREWWNRVMAVLLVAVCAWVGLFGAVILGPAIYNNVSTLGLALTTLGIGSSAGGYGVYKALGKRKGSPHEGKKNGILLKFAPSVFVCLIVLLIFAITTQLGVKNLNLFGSGFTEFLLQTVKALNQASEKPSFTGLLVTLSALIFVNLFYNPNWHSLYHFYKSRLVRCFLGASHKPVQNSRLDNDYVYPSGFDPDDDMAMEVLANQRPYHIVCTTMNITASKELAYQKRMAASFVFTPQYCGYELPHSCQGDNEENASFFIPSVDYMRKNQEDMAVSLGTAMTISGAAASPNMGYHSNGVLAFLMALFNVRLGRWSPNPKRYKKWMSIDPRMGVLWFIRELFCKTHENVNYVYLSDGGHFENMGIYELVRRKCKYIVLVDGEEDSKWEFGGFAEAVRKCRMDHNAEIEIDLTPMKPAEKSKHSPISYAFGTIKYSKPESEGTLLYLKLSLPEMKQLPVDVINYVAMNGNFPHQSTTDQWFDETQFESYRKLGETIAKLALESKGPTLREALDTQKINGERKV